MRQAALIGLVACVLAAPALGADNEPSVSGGFKEVGKAIEDGAVKGYDKAKDATLHGVGTAIDKTGEGLNKAGEKMQGAGDTVKDKAE